MLFSKDGSVLYTGARKDGEIIGWDLRQPGKVLFTAEREVATNQVEALVPKFMSKFFKLMYLRPSERKLMSSSIRGSNCATLLAEGSSSPPAPMAVSACGTQVRRPILRFEPDIIFMHLIPKNLTTRIF